MLSANRVVDMPTRLNFLVAFACTLAVVPATHAQEDLARLAVSDPNQFVRQVQQELKDTGRYPGTVDGLLDQETIVAINDACRAAQLIDRCHLGPLSSVGAQAVVSALRAGSLSDATPQTPPLPSTAPASAAAIEWLPGNSRNGIEVALDTENQVYQATARGVAHDDKWTNIISSKPLPATPGQVLSFTVTAATNIANEGTATLRVAVFNADGYAGELRLEGVPIDVSNPEQDYVLIGQVPQGAERLVTYIQLLYPSGVAVNDTVTISRATVAPTTS